MLYGRVLQAPFVYDDFGSIVDNEQLKSFKSAVGHFLTSPVWLSNGFRGQGGQTYRPLHWMSLAIDYQLWGMKTSLGFHLNNLFIHWLNAVLLFAFLRKLSSSLRLSAISAMIWLALPINSEVVAWISARSYLLCTFFLLSGLHSILHFLKTNSKISIYCYFLFALAALLSNEAGILLIPLTLAILWAEKSNPKNWMLPAGASLAACLFYAGLRGILKVQAAHGPSSFWAVGREFFLYLEWMILPLKMSIERSTSAPPNSLSLLSLVAWIGLILYLVAAYTLRKRAKVIAVAMLWVGAALIPYCGIVFLYQGMAERYEYLATIGLALLLGSLLENSIRDARTVRVTGVILAVWMIWGIWRLESRLGDWGDPVALYESSLKATPKSKTLPIDLASTFISRAVESEKSGNLDAAEKDFRQAILYAPNEIPAYNNLGVLLFRRGKRQEGIQLLNKAISLDPGNPDPYFNLAFLYQEIGRGDLAVPLYEQVLRLHPNDQDAIEQIKKLNFQ